MKAALPERITTFQFDYSVWSSHWASSSHIAACLATYVRSVSDAHGRVDGDGKVVLVAHSMGGLAARYALTPGNGALTSATVSDLITIDTPHLGSPWGGTVYAEVKAAFHENLPGLLGEDAANCLQPHDNGSALPAQCGGLPPWLPADVSLAEIAGNVTVDRSLFGIPLYSNTLGHDGVVSVRSSHGYATSGPGGQANAPRHNIRTSEDGCHLKLEALIAMAGDLLGAEIAHTLAPVVALRTAANALTGHFVDPEMQMYFGAVALLAQCGHADIVKDQSAINQVIESIKASLAKHTPRSTKLTSEAIYRAPVPSMCRHPAGTLVDGRLPGIPAIDGFVELLALGSPAEADNPIVFGDLSGDGKADAAVLYMCSRGGVGWPHNIVLYGPGPVVLGSVDLGEITPNEHANVRHMQIEGGDVALRWNSYEGASSCMREWSARLHWDGTRATITNLKQLSGKQSNYGC
ncbi:esterase/lipase family protein [Lentzea sp. NPDC059081]|uniref:esterase/lipase family protein n=1 Tax=Lentzea sp. NPDC059081 TaxID=3346719 RepID=UPI00367CB8B2